MSGGAGAPIDKASVAATAALLKRLRAAAGRGDADAQLDLAWALLHRNGVPADAVEAAGWVRRAAEGGCVPAMEWMCAACRKGAPGVPPVDLAQSYRWAVRGGDAGSALCQLAAGDALLKGHGVAKDEATAVRWFRRAAGAGHATAQLNLYVRYRDGEGGLRPDDPTGLAYLRAAAEGGYNRAQAELSRVLRDGIGVPADAAGANAWGLRAAEGGHVGAQADMGKRLLYGLGIATDSVAGVALLRQALAADNLDSCVHLGNAHALGLGGLPVDVAAARALYDRAAAGSDADVAVKARNLLRELNSPAMRSDLGSLRTVAPPVCGYVCCGAALDAGTLSGLCAGCRAVRFCGADCQRAAWAAHRPTCRAAAAKRAAALAAASCALSASSPGGSAAATLNAERAEVEMWFCMPLDALRQAAEGGTAAAQYTLGDAYMLGMLGVDKGAVAGRAWLRKSAGGGLLVAQFNLGTETMHDADTPGADKAALLRKAADCFRPAAEAGDAASHHNMYVCCARLARISSGGEAGALWAEAGRWLRAAAAQGFHNSLDALGTAAWHGHPGMGVARDRDEARRLFAAADAAGLPEKSRGDRPAGAPGSTMGA